VIVCRYTELSGGICCTDPNRTGQDRTGQDSEADVDKTPTVGVFHTTGTGNTGKERPDLFTLKLTYSRKQ